jgi:hypothetical protein
MTSGTVVTTLGRKIALNRLFKAVPDYTAPTIFDVGTGNTTPNITDTALVTPISLDKTFVTGYPILDETNMQSTIRCLILTTEANGNSLTEFGLKNTDGTKKLFSRAVYTAITKTSAVQIIYVEKDLII